MKNKIIALFLGFIILIVFLEFFLLILSQYKLNNSQNVSSGKPVILFIGNSYTAGVEVRPDQKFSSLIQNMLPDFDVHNTAKVNIGTGYIRDHIDEWAQLKPKIVFLMIGEPNAWNNEGYLRFLNEKNRIVNSFYKVLIFINNYSRVFKLFSYFNYQLKLSDKQLWSNKSSNDSELYCQKIFRDYIIAYDSDSLKDPNDKFLKEETPDRLTDCVNQNILKYPEILMPRYIRITRMILQNKPIEMLMPDFMFLTKNGTKYNHFVYEYCLDINKKNKLISDPIFLKLKNNLFKLVKNKFLKDQIEIIKDAKPLVFFQLINSKKSGQ